MEWFRIDLENNGYRYYRFVQSESFALAVAEGARFAGSLVTSVSRVTLEEQRQIADTD